MTVHKLSPDESITGLNSMTIGDFWSWAYSDLMNNVNRSAFAEFLVGAALGVIDQPRIEWDAVDIRYRGKTIEVKTAAYLQSWPQERPSSIRFDIEKKTGWFADTNTIADEPTRAADCYVFCLYAETEPVKANVLNLEAWEFYVLATERINSGLGDQKSLGIGVLRGMCNAVGYTSLKAEIDSLLGGRQ